MICTEQGAIDVALGVFPNPPWQTICKPLFQERFVGIARRGHPAITNKSMSLERFARLSHALVTIRRDATGEIDKVLASYNLKRRIALTIPHMLVLASVLEVSNLVSSVPYRVALRFVSISNLEIFELPMQTDAWMVSMMWSKLAHKDSANC